MAQIIIIHHQHLLQGDIDIDHIDGIKIEVILDIVVIEIKTYGDESGIIQLVYDHERIQIDNDHVHHDTMYHQYWNGRKYMIYGIIVIRL